MHFWCDRVVCTVTCSKPVQNLSNIVVTWLGRPANLVCVHCVSLKFLHLRFFFYGLHHKSLLPPSPSLLNRWVSLFYYYPNPSYCLSQFIMYIYVLHNIIMFVFTCPCIRYGKLNGPALPFVYFLCRSWSRQLYLHGCCVLLFVIVWYVLLFMSLYSVRNMLLQGSFSVILRWFWLHWTFNRWRILISFLWPTEGPWRDVYPTRYKSTRRM